MIYVTATLFACAAGTADTHPERIGVLENDALDEASGLASSRIHPDTLWTINDSGSEPVLYAVTTSGADMGLLVVTDARNRDWEDLAAFTYRKKSYLVVGDVGDNAGRRNDCTIYVVEEPETIGKGIHRRTKTTPAWRITYRYEDGPRDCESIAVDMAAQQILLLSKRTTPPVLYTLPLFPPKNRSDAIARRVTELPTIKNTAPGTGPLPYFYKHHPYRYQPTGMDISPNNALMAVLTYRHILIYQRLSGQDWADAVKRPPRTRLLPPLDQAEAVCFGPAGRSLFVTSERRPAPLYRIDLESFSSN